jgi:hypothetical protein
MRLLKAQNTNLRNIYGKGVKYDINDRVFVDSNNVMLIPKGTTSQRPVDATTGDMRYNTDNNEFEVYQGTSATWKRLAYKQPTAIVQQQFGPADGIETKFGPLNPQWNNDGGDYESYSIGAGEGNQIIVLVENVMQIHGSSNNFIIEENPAGYAAGNYISFSSAPPAAGTGGADVYITVLYHFDK